MTSLGATMVLPVIQWVTAATNSRLLYFTLDCGAPCQDERSMVVASNYNDMILEARIGA